ncbi:unnamed protein product [Sphagnum compactum]
MEQPQLVDDVSRRNQGVAFLSSVKAVFEDFTGRRAGMLKALTCDIDELLRQCDPYDDEQTNLCLFGFPDKSWEVMEPSRHVPAKLPEPFLGINHTSHLMARSHEHWLLFVASHSDAWLLSTAFFAASTLDREQKASLFDLINELPTLYQVLSSKISANNIVRTSIEPEVNHESSCLGAAAAQDPMKKLPEEEEEEEEFRDFSARRIGDPIGAFDCLLMSAAARDPMKESPEEDEELRDFSARTIGDPISAFDCLLMVAAARDPMKESPEEEEESRDFSARTIGDPISAFDCLLMKSVMSTLGSRDSSSSAEIRPPSQLHEAATKAKKHKTS